ncbi:S-phase kinase-associated protein 1 [Drosophila tropicalis]|uniref:S-phase kinase-associated protein 1 n=1 Tax=Drosophila tropicalis TaxID=46794 RepID=UPI0035AC1C26
MPTVKLQSSDGEIFETDDRAAECSGTIKTLLKDCQLDDAESQIIPLPNVNSMILAKVLLWVNHHKEDEPADDSDEERTHSISQWDADFLQVDQATLFELIMAANYLDIQGLMEVTCKTVANMIMGHTPEEIRRLFNIQKDFTSSEEELVRNESEWVEERD